MPYREPSPPANRRVGWLRRTWRKTTLSDAVALLWLVIFSAGVLVLLGWLTWLTDGAVLILPGTIIVVAFTFLASEQVRDWWRYLK